MNTLYKIAQFFGCLIYVALILGGVVGGIIFGAAYFLSECITQAAQSGCFNTICK